MTGGETWEVSVRVPLILLGSNPLSSVAQDLL
jgi:hypothetical protein